MTEKTEKKKENEKTPNKEAVLQEAYVTVARQFSLPAFDTLNADFDLDTIEPETKHLVREVAKKLYERLDMFKKILETTVQPDVSILSMQEAEFLSEADHNTITDILHRLMYLDRTLLLAELQNDDAHYAAYILESHAAWQQIKKELSPLFKKMQAGWSKPNSAKKHQHYVG